MVSDRYDMFANDSIMNNVSNFHRRARIGLILVRGPRDFPTFDSNGILKELNLTIVLTLERRFLTYLLSL